MIRLTYLFHCGFVLETDHCVLVFDYWMDPAQKMERFIGPQNQKPIYVFVSHFHEDHFTKEIFTWKATTPDITYILSKDILKHHRACKEDADMWMTKGMVWNDSHIQVTATGSNDSGVSWIIETAGYRIFHAGDLCNWFARFLAEGTPEGKVYSEECDQWIDPVAEEKQFLGELKDIKKIADSFDVVMFPIDGRIGNGYTLGARQFIERFKVGLLVPMHFVMSGFDSVWRMEPFCQEKNIPFWCIRNEGDSITLADHLVIRQTAPEDLPRLKEIFAIARKFMSETGNPGQWDENYPGDQLLREDMDNGDSYVIQKGNTIVATFVLRGGTDPTYNVIYDGQWLNDEPYAVIHRVASSGEVKGVIRVVLDFARRQYRNIRVDTHADNKVMQHLMQKEGFRYCGVIHCWNGTERLAYQYVQ